MTPLQIFAFFVLPVAIVALGGLVYLLEGRRRHPRADEPDLFDKKPLQTPGE